MLKRLVIFVFLVPVVLFLGYLTGCATAGQPHMQAALEQLRAARHELEIASTDKGGHRARAIELCDQALEQVRAGIEFAANH